MEQFKANSRDAGKRLDRYLVNKMSGYSRQAVKKMIDEGRVKINGRRVIIAKWEMIEGDDVKVNLRGFERKSDKKIKHGKEEHGLKSINKRLYIDSVFEDRDVIVVNKPAGVVTQGRSPEGSFIDSLRGYIKGKYRGRGAYVKAVHRLDKETSGLMVFATSKIGEKLVDQFKRHSVRRSYLAVVDGPLKKNEGRIEYRLKKGDFGHGKKVTVARKGEGRRSLTEYRVQERYGNATFVQLNLKTGRTHQARVHMAAISHPIVGDKIYGRKDGIDFNRQALHSAELAFKHPANGKPMNFKSDLPEDIKELVNSLRGI